MPGRLRERSRLSPPRHAPVDQPGIAREKDFGAETATLHHARPVAFDQDIGAIGRREADRASLVGPDVGGQRVPSAIEYGIRPACPPRAIDAQDLGAKVGKK